MLHTHRYIERHPLARWVTSIAVVGVAAIGAVCVMAAGSWLVRLP